MPGKYVYAVFKLHELPESVQVKEGIGKILKPRIGILGSIPELGAWNFKKNIKASPTPKFDKWEARVLIPAGSVFEWSWILTDYKCTKVLFWDPCKRNTTLGTIGGTVHVAWGRPTQVFKSDTCGVEVSVNYHCPHGQYLVVTGEEPSLGNWNPKMGVEAREEFPPGSGRWKSHLVLEKMYEYQWKWVVVEGPNREVVRWENRGNRYLYIDEDIERIELEAPWDNFEYFNTHSYRFKPDFEDKTDDIELLTVKENLEAMEEMNGRRVEERNQPRRRPAKQEKTHKKQPKVSFKRKRRVGHPGVQGQVTNATSSNLKAEDPPKTSGFSLFGWISSVFTTYLDLMIDG